MNDTLRGALVVGTVMSFMGTATAGMVGPGIDFLQTQPGTSFNFGSLGMPLIPGLVPLLGNPSAGDFFDTAISRSLPAIIDGPTAGGPAVSDPIPIEIVALSLVSVDPVGGAGPLANSFFDVFVELDLTTLSSGIMTINHELDDRTGPSIDTVLGPQPQTGTWSTLFTLNLVFTLVDVDNILVDTVIRAPLDMMGFGSWTHGPNGEFLLGPILEEHVGGAGTHMASQVIPLPSALGLGLAGLAPLIVVRRRRL